MAFPPMCGRAGDYHPGFRDVGSKMAENRGKLMRRAAFGFDSLAKNR
jgi:hypothetical protein